MRSLDWLPSTMVMAMRSMSSLGIGFPHKLAGHSLTDYSAFALFVKESASYVCEPWVYLDQTHALLPTEEE